MIDCYAFQHTVCSLVSEWEWLRRLDTCIIASTIHYACKLTSETLLSTGKPCRLSTVINVKSLKTSGNTSEKLSRGKVTKNTIAVNEDIAEISHSFPHLSPVIPDALSHKNYETFLSWGNCFYSNLILLFRLLSSHPKTGFVWGIGVLTRLNSATLDVTQGDRPSCHTSPVFLICWCHSLTPVHVIACYMLENEVEEAAGFLSSSHLISLLLTPELLALFARWHLCDWYCVRAKRGECFLEPNEWVTPKIKEMEDENQDLLWWGTLAEQNSTGLPSVCEVTFQKKCV